MPQGGRRAIHILELLSEAGRGLARREPLQAADEIHRIAPLQAAEAEEAPVGIADEGRPRILMQRAPPDEARADAPQLRVAAGDLDQVRPEACQRLLAGRTVWPGRSMWSRALRHGLNRAAGEPDVASRVINDAGERLDVEGPIAETLRRHLQ